MGNEKIGTVNRICNGNGDSDGKGKPMSNNISVITMSSANEA